MLHTYHVTSPVPDTNLSLVTKEAKFPTVSPVPWVPVETDSAHYIALIMYTAVTCKV